MIEVDSGYLGYPTVALENSLVSEASVPTRIKGFTTRFQGDK